MKNKIQQTIIISTIFVIIFSNIASAGFAVGFPYKISLHRGESYEGSFSLQNVIPPTEETTVKIKVTEGEEYITFPEGTTFQLAANEIKNVPVKISLPQDADGGKIYKAKIIFEPVSGGVQNGGIVSLRFSVGKNFDIEVIGNTKAERLAKIASVILFIVVIILIIVLIKVLKNKKRKSK